MSALEELVEMAGNPDHLGYTYWEKTTAEAKAELTAWKKSVEGLGAQTQLLEKALAEAEHAREHWKGKCEVFETRLSLGCETPEETVERIAARNNSLVAQLNDAKVARERIEKERDSLSSEVQAAVEEARDLLGQAAVRRTVGEVIHLLRMELREERELKEGWREQAKSHADDVRALRASVAELKGRLEPAKPRRLLTVCDCSATDLAHVHIEDLRIEVSR